MTSARNTNATPSVDTDSYHDTRSDFMIVCQVTLPGGRVFATAITVDGYAGLTQEELFRLLIVAGRRRMLLGAEYCTND